MNKKPALVILAAGMGSRYGGLKQLDTFTKEGDTIIDFSIYDAIEAGFGKIIFIIRQSFEVEFKEIFSKKLKDKIEIVYVYQELDKVPTAYINPNRVKPWGTGHALLLLEDVIKENFAIINADDFYGKEAFKVMAKSLIETDKNSYQYKTMAYLLENTVSEYGSVSRGECKVDSDGFLLGVTERTQIQKVENTYIRKDNNGNSIPIDGKTIVSMNFWGFTPTCFEYGKALFLEFLEENKENIKAEFYIPSLVNEIVTSAKAKITVLESDANWFGVTYKEDKENVVNAICALKNSNKYPKNLWSAQYTSTTKELS
ncbi:sugar phosphate nucleotidyltransferase [Polaribacter sp.]|uniref:sugar phosphate nucleotidyltransferase n=1 Tax=Polaribacter sp. TaxID=1920175 RepID=UPI003EFAB4EB